MYPLRRVDDNQFEPEDEERSEDDHQSVGGERRRLAQAMIAKDDAEDDGQVREDGAPEVVDDGDSKAPAGAALPPDMRTFDVRLSLTTRSAVLKKNVPIENLSEPTSGDGLDSKQATSTVATMPNIIQIATTT